MRLGAKCKVTVTETVTDSVSCEKCGVLMDSGANKSRLMFERIAADESPA